MDARRVRERVRADDGLVGLDRDAGELGVETAGGHDAIRLHARVGLVVVATDAQRHHDLLEGGVAAALTDAVDAHMDLLRPGLHRGERVRGREPEIVTAADDPERDFAAVRDEDLLERRRAQRSAVSAQAGGRP